MSAKEAFSTDLVIAQIKERNGKGMSKLKWFKNPGGAWGKAVEVRTPRGGTIYKHPTENTIYQSAREALYCGRLDLWGDTPTFDEQLDLLRDVLSLIAQKTPVPAIAVKLFGGNRVLLDHYLSWLRAEFLAHPDNDPERWVLSREAEAILLMLKQAPTPAAHSEPEARPTQPKQTRRRRVMMEMRAG